MGRWRRCLLVAVLGVLVLGAHEAAAAVAAPEAALSDPSVTTPDERSDAILDDLEAVSAAGRDHLLGVINSGRRNAKLVIVDARTGAIVRNLLQLNPRETFPGMALDRQHRRLWVLSAHRDFDLYSIDIPTLKIKHYGNLRIERRGGSLMDVASLAYDSRTDTLFTAIEYGVYWDPGPLQRRPA